MMNQPHRPIFTFGVVLAIPALLMVAPTAGAQQQSPSPSTSATTNLRTLVVAPKSTPRNASTPQVNLRVQRRALNFNPDSGSSSSATPAQSTKPASKHPMHGVKHLPPQPLHVFAPRYPTTALTDHQQGTVTVIFTVQPDGSTTNIRIVSSEPSGVFDAAARTAIQHWLFDPATADGIPVASQVRQTLVFRPPAKTGSKAPVEPNPQPSAARQTPANLVPGNIHPTHLVPPQYPPNAYRAHQGGSVTLSFTVTPSGYTRHIRVLTSRPRYIFDRAAIEAVQQWRFKPVKTPTRVVQTIRFTPPR